MAGLIIEVLGWLAAGSTVAAYAMKTMIPLRIAAITSSVLFLIYGALAPAWPVFAMEVILLPLNAWRFWQLISIRRRIESARTGEVDDFSALEAYGKVRTFRAGEEIFRRGDAADALYLIRSGTAVADTYATEMGKGEIFGEVAFFTDAATRTSSVRAVEDMEVYEVNEAAFLRLHFQDPAFGMSVMRLITRRLLEEARRVRLANTDLAAARERS